MNKGFKVSRRDLARLITAGAVGLGVLRTSLAAAAAAAPASPEPGMKFGLRWSSNPTDQDLLFLKQIGATHVSVTIPIPPSSDITQLRLPTLDQLLAIKARYESAGLKVHKFMGPLMIPPKEVVLNLPGRDHAIDLYKQWIQVNSQAGFYCVGASYMLTSVWQSGKVATRFAPTREFDASAPSFQNGYERDKPAFGRDYSRDEIIANYNYFIRQIAPVAERAGVAIAFHPDDVPVYDKLAGVPRIFNNFSEIKERLAAANSPNVGMILCCGVWIEGGADMGCSVEDAVRYFVSNHRVWEIHFRNVSSTLPKFNEAFMDNGVYDMYKIMKTVYDSGYRELIHYDHTPDMVGAPYAYPAYAFGYMHACYQRAVAGSPVTGRA
jgi:mannonate dehydratase